jgi:hypothetical protein
MDRGDASEALIVGVQCACHGGKPGHEPVGTNFSAIGAAEQPLDVVLVADDELSVALFDQRRAADEQIVVGEGEAEIFIAGFAETSRVTHRLVDHGRSGYGNKFFRMSIEK